MKLQPFCQVLCGVSISYPYGVRDGFCEHTFSSHGTSSGEVLKSTWASAAAMSSMLYMAAILPAQSGWRLVMKCHAPVLQSYQQSV